jgi:hypothetical protein
MPGTVHTLNSSTLRSNRPTEAAVYYEEATGSSPQPKNIMFAGPTPRRWFCLNINDTFVVINLQSVNEVCIPTVLIKNDFL